MLEIFEEGRFTMVGLRLDDGCTTTVPFCSLAAYNAYILDNARISVSKHAHKTLT